MDSGSTMGSSSEDSCGPGNLSGTGNISIGTRSGQYQIHENAIVLSTLNKEKSSIYPGLSLKQMGKDNEGFFVDAIRVNPTKMFQKILYL